MSTRARGAVAVALSGGLSSGLVDICIRHQRVEAVGVLARRGDPGAEFAVRRDRHTFRVGAPLDFVDEGAELLALGPRLRLALQDAELYQLLKVANYATI